MADNHEARFAALKVTIESGNLKTFQQIFQIVPKTVVKEKLGYNYTSFSRKVSDPTQFSVEELRSLAKLFQIDTRLLLEQILIDLGDLPATL